MCNFDVELIRTHPSYLTLSLPGKFFTKLGNLIATNCLNNFSRDIVINLYAERESQSRFDEMEGNVMISAQTFSLNFSL